MNRYVCCGGTWGCLHGLDAEEHEALFPAENNKKPCLLFDQKKKSLCVFETVHVYAGCPHEKLTQAVR